MVVLNKRFGYSIWFKYFKPLNVELRFQKDFHNLQLIKDIKLQNV